MAKEKVSVDEKFEKQDFDLFEALKAVDRKDYSYFDRLSEEQQRKFSSYMLIHYMSAVSSKNKEIEQYYVCATNEAANKHIFNEFVMGHPKLQWLMLCAISPGLGQQFHKWIPHIRDKVTKLKEPAKAKEIKDYYSKIYSGVSSNDLNDITDAFIDDNKKKYYLAQVYPNLKHDDIEVLSQLITHADIEKYERERGN